MTHDPPTYISTKMDIRGVPRTHAVSTPKNSGNDLMQTVFFFFFGKPREAALKVELPIIH